MSFFPAKILLATDGSEEADRALKTSVDLAESTGSELHVVMVEELPYAYDAPTVREPTSGFFTELHKRARKRLDRELEKVRSAGGTVAEAHLRIECYELRGRSHSVLQFFIELKSAHHNDSRMYWGASMRFMKSLTVTGAYALPSSVSIRGAHLGALKPPLQQIASDRSAESDSREGNDEMARASTPEGSQFLVFEVSSQPYHRASADVHGQPPQAARCVTTHNLNASRRSPVGDLPAPLPTEAEAFAGYPTLVGKSFVFSKGGV